MAGCTFHYNRRQWTTFTIVALTNFTSAANMAILAPFYPRFAEEKGATPTQYGFIFGIFRLVMLIVSPLYGKYLNEIGAKFMLLSGLFAQGITSILFGYLDEVNNALTFVSLSFAVRIVGAVFCAGFTISRNSLIAAEFPKTIGTIFAVMELCFGLGQFTGPTVGGALFQLGGFRLPFVALGWGLLFVTIIGMAALPADGSCDNKDAKHSNQTSMLQALKVPIIAFFAFTIVAECITSGFLQATLEPHLRKLDLTPVQLGFMFVINGGAYALSAPIWGQLSDKLLSPRLLVLFGAVIVSISFLLVGPAPFIPLPTSLPLCILALILVGVGCSAELVATFGGSLKAAHEAGFPVNISTCGLISGLWTTSFALGSFIGPSIGGFLMEEIGFKPASLIVAAIHIILAFITILFICCSHKIEHAKPNKGETSSLLNKDNAVLDSTYGSLE